MDLIDTYSKEDFSTLSIHTLRILAREVGVEAPTTKNKAQLIDAIVVKRDERNAAIAAGTYKPKTGETFVPAKRGKGRPPKRDYVVFRDSGSESGGNVEEEEEFVPTENNPAPYIDKNKLRILYGLTSDVGGAFNEKEKNNQPTANNVPSQKAAPVEKRSETKASDRAKPDTEGGRYDRFSERQTDSAEMPRETPERNAQREYPQQGREYSREQKRPYGKLPLKKRFDGGASDWKEGGYYKERFTKEDNAGDSSAPIDETEIPLEIKEGILEIMADGYGFLRAQNYESGANDAYISLQKIKRFGLRKGDKVKAEARQTCENKPAGVVNILSVNDIPYEKLPKRINFDTLTPIYPDVRYRLEIPGQSNDFAIRSIDLIAPIGKGQRAMIVSPPKAGKTTLLKKVAHSISENYPNAHLIVLLIDERPEEVTDMQRSIDGEVVYSTFDEMPEHHTKAAELVLERAKRLVEMGEDVVILMDSLTRLARAYNLTISPTGRTLSGGIDPGALHSPKRFFGAARNIENGGSLTIIATALVDTGSRMDDVIYEEFKGTGNMEIHLDRRLSEKRIFPAIDLNRSGTRREELLLDQTELQGIWAVRKLLSAGGESADATENLLNMMIKTKNNKEFIQQVNLQVISMQKQGFLV